MVPKATFVAVAVWALVASPSWAQSSDASADSTRGANTTKTNKADLSIRTGADTGSGPVTSAAPKVAAGSGDSPVLNAPGETVPGTKGTAQPSNLNGQ